MANLSDLVYLLRLVMSRSLLTVFAKVAANDYAPADIHDGYGRNRMVWVPEQPVGNRHDADFPPTWVDEEETIVPLDDGQA
jgi:hypothetical protein